MKAKITTGLQTLHFPRFWTVVSGTEGTSTGGYKITSSSYWTGFSIANPVDDTIPYDFYFAPGSTTGTIELEFPLPTILEHVVCQNRKDAANYQFSYGDIAYYENGGWNTMTSWSNSVSQAGGYYDLLSSYSPQEYEISTRWKINIYSMATPGGSLASLGIGGKVLTDVVNPITKSGNNIKMVMEN